MKTEGKCAHQHDIAAPYLKARTGRPPYANAHTNGTHIECRMSVVYSVNPDVGYRTDSDASGVD
jgi:hypothetical protein